VTLSQRHDLSILALISGETDLAVRLGSTIPGPFPLRRLATTHYRRLVTRTARRCSAGSNRRNCSSSPASATPASSSHRRSLACSPAKQPPTKSRGSALTIHPGRAASRRRVRRREHDMRLAADAAHQFGGIELDRSKPLSFRLDGRKISGFAGDTVLSAVLAAGLDSYGQFDGATLGLSERFAPLIATKRGDPLPMERTPAIDGLDLTTVGPRPRFAFGRSQSLRHRLDDLADPPWLRTKPDTTLTADLLSSVAASPASPRPMQPPPQIAASSWSNGGPGSAVMPAISRRRRRRDARSADHPPRRPAAGRAKATLLPAQRPSRSAATPRCCIRSRSSTAPRAAAWSPSPPRASSSLPGATQRLPVFPAIASKRRPRHRRLSPLAKRYGVVHGPSAVVATQSNYGYRLALRLHDAGITLRVSSTRVSPRNRASSISPRPAASPSARGNFRSVPTANTSPSATLPGQQQH